MDTLLELSNTNLTIRINGESKEVKCLDDSNSSFPKGSYYILENIISGDQIEITAEAPGLSTVSSHTIVPAKTMIKKITMIKKAGKDEGGDDLQFQVTFQDDPSTANYYAIKAERYEEAWDKDDYYPTCQYQQMKNIDLELDEEPLLQQAGVLDNLFFEFDDSYGGLYPFTDQEINGQEYTLHLNTYYSPSLEDDDRFYTYIYCYRITLYSISKEFYLYLQNLLDQQNNNLSDSGFSPIQPTYTNIQNGLGIVGGYQKDPSQWIDNL